MPPEHPAIPGPPPILLTARDEETYGRIRRIARRALGPEAARHTLPPTAVANEVFLRLTKPGADGPDRASLLAQAGAAVRSVLVDHARRRSRRKRGGDRQRVRLDPATVPAPPSAADAAEISDAVDALARHDARAAAVVELRFFGGLDIEHTARCLGVSSATVERDWRFARAWLKRALGETGAEVAPPARPDEPPPDPGARS